MPLKITIAPAVLASTAALASAAALPRRAFGAANAADVTGGLARYMVSVRERPLPDSVILDCKHRILDTFGAMISGVRMTPA